MRGLRCNARQEHYRRWTSCKRDNDEGEDKMAIATKSKRRNHLKCRSTHSSGLGRLACPSDCGLQSDYSGNGGAYRQNKLKRPVYESGGNVGFDVQKCNDYGKFAKSEPRKLKARPLISSDRL